MIFYETRGQAGVFAALVCAGFAAAVLLDVTGGLRRLVPAWAGWALDVMWGLLAAGACGLALAVSGEGSVRFYALPALCCGAAVYGLGLRSAALGIVRWVRKKREKKK